MPRTQLIDAETRLTSASTAALPRTDGEIAADVAAAIAGGRLDLVLQPVVASGSGLPVFYECLLRMQDAAGLEMSVAEFVPAVERLGLQAGVDRQVLERSVGLLAAAPGLSVSINLSALTLVDSGWLTRLQQLLATEASVARRLIVEVTETAAIDDVGRAREFVAVLQRLGVRVAIDDFGAGHTSLSALEKLRPDIVKMDGSFIAGAGGGRIDRVFVAAVVRNAAAAGMESVAEWVSDAASAAILRDLGVTYLQGEAFGLPQPWGHWAAA